MTTRMIDGREEQVEAEGEWAKLSAEMTSMIDLLTGSPKGKWGKLEPGRRDVVVTIAPGAGHGSKACFAHNYGRIEIDGANLEVEPGRVRPARYWNDREKIGATWGLLCHEAAHSVHTQWGTAALDWLNSQPGPAEKVSALRVLEAAKLLEEPRIEARQIDRRPWDERWLRMSASTHLLGELSKGPGLTSRYVAMHAATLVGGRLQAGLLTEKETETILQAASAVMGAGYYMSLMNLIRQVIGRDDKAIDTEWDNMMSYAQEWIKILDAEASGQVPDEMMMSLSMPGDGQGEGGSSGGQDGEESEGEESEGDGDEGDGDEDGDKEEDKRAKAGDKERKAARAVKEAMGPGSALAVLLEAAGKLADEMDEGGGWLPFDIRRGEKFKPVWIKAEPEQTRAAESLRLRLLEWFMPERSAARTDQVLPPGRLNGRMALKRDGERAAGTIPTATPWRHVVRRMVPTPPLRAGMAVDVSGSMEHLAAASREIAYRFSTALGGLPDARFRGMLAGEGTALMQSQPRQIPKYGYNHGCEAVHEACADLVERLALTRRGNARLLVIISDGVFSQEEHFGTVKAMRQVVKSGGTVLWIDFEGSRGATPRSVIEVPGVKYVIVPKDPRAAVRAAEEALIDVMKSGAAATAAMTRR